MKLSILLFVGAVCGLGVTEEFENQTFTVKDASNSSNVCLRLTAVITIDITYTNTSGRNASKSFPLTGHAEHHDSTSTCNTSASRATLYVTLNESTLNESLALEEIDEMAMNGNVSLVFYFNGTSGDNGKWSIKNMTFFLDPIFLGSSYNATNNTLTFVTEKEINDSATSELDLQTSFKCNTNQAVPFISQDVVYPVVHISKLQVQAFKFRNYTTGEFDNPQSCLADTTGKANKIVPIAVGAALAGLVVVVLIAYLIGRLRSRKQSSYEALS